MSGVGTGNSPVHLSGLGLAWCHLCEAVDSTNLEALRRGRAGAGVPGLVLAGTQLAGRGSRGRRWTSPPGGLWMTLLVTIPPPAVLPWLALGAGAAAAEAIAATTGIGVQVKWPNDLLAGGRKLGGVLVETARGHAAVGVGINANNDPPTGLPAVCLKALTGCPVDLWALARACVSRILAYHQLLLAGDPASVAAAWRRLDALAGRRVALETAEGARVITCLGIALSGALVYQDENRRAQTLHATASVRLHLLPGSPSGPSV